MGRALREVTESIAAQTSEVTGAVSEVVFLKIPPGRLGGRLVDALVSRPMLITSSWSSPSPCPAAVSSIRLLSGASWLMKGREEACVV
jgi:hypothetical protein